MDIKCVKCGEPWDMDCIHEEVAERWENEPWKINGKHDQEKYEKYYNQIRDEFYKDGCRTFSGARCNTDTIPNKNGDVLSELYGAFGDDVDAMAGMIEDFGL